MRSCAIACGCLLLALAAAPACAPRPAPPSTPASLPEAVEDAAGGGADAEVPPAPEPLPVVALSPLWETVARPEEGFAGLAVWPGAGQRPWLVVAAAASHRLVLFDAESGELLREVGALGDRAGSFREPVAVAVGGDLAFVVERGNARVQVLRLPGLATVGFLGEGELRRPAAVAVEPAGEGWTVWVGEEDTSPGQGARPELSVHRFAVAADGSSGAGLRQVVPLDVPLALPLVVAGRLTSAAAYPCESGGGWLVALENGEILALAGPSAAAVALLAVDGVAALGSLAVAAGPIASLPAGNLYAVTADSRIVAVAGADLAVAVAPLICD